MIEKIDIIDQSVICYNDQFEVEKRLQLSDFENVKFDYLNESKLFSININTPIKRVVKFTSLNTQETVAEFTEYPYSDMTADQQAEFDNFVQQANNL